MAIRLGRPVAERLARPTRRAVRKPTRGPKRRPPSYSVLLPVGFTLPPPSPKARCALTAPFHPYPRTQAEALARRRFAFCGTFPWGRPRRALPGTVFPWSPDFPPCRFPIARSSHPAIRRHIIIVPKQLPAKVVKNWKRHIGSALQPTERVRISVPVHFGLTEVALERGK